MSIMQTNLPNFAEFVRGHLLKCKAHTPTGNKDNEESLSHLEILLREKGFKVTRDIHDTLRKNGFGIRVEIHGRATRTYVTLNKGDH